MIQSSLFNTVGPGLEPVGLSAIHVIPASLPTRWEVL